MDFEGNPFSYLKQVVFSGAVAKTCCVPGKDPLQCDIPAGVARGGASAEGEVSVHLELWGHYNEPDVTLKFKLTPGTGKPWWALVQQPLQYNHVTFAVDVSLSYDPFTGEWTITKTPPEDQVVGEVAQKLEAAKIWWTFQTQRWILSHLFSHNKMFK